MGENLPTVRVNAIPAAAVNGQTPTGARWVFTIACTECNSAGAGGSQAFMHFSDQAVPDERAIRAELTKHLQATGCRHEVGPFVWHNEQGQPMSAEERSQRILGEALKDSLSTRSG
jgi:hypothetical protein